MPVADAWAFLINNRLFVPVPAPSYIIFTRPPEAVVAKLVPPASIFIAEPVVIVSALDIPITLPEVVFGSSK